MSNDEISLLLDNLLERDWAWFSDENLREYDYESLMDLYQELTHNGIMTVPKVELLSRLVNIMKEKEDD